jgi:hypothetical protein
MIVLQVIGGIVSFVLGIVLVFFLWDLFKTALSNQFCANLSDKTTQELKDIRGTCNTLINGREEQEANDKHRLRQLLKVYGPQVLNEVK